MYTVRKKFTVEMSHQLERAYSSCCTDCIHGHSYTIELFFTASVLDENGMVIDFGEVKEVCKPVIDQFDHALVLPKSLAEKYGPHMAALSKKLIIVDANPTAEWMAFHLYTVICQALPELFKVRVHETVTGWAEWFEDKKDQI